VYTTEDPNKKNTSTAHVLHVDRETQTNTTTSL